MLFWLPLQIDTGDCVDVAPSEKCQKRKDKGHCEDNDFITWAYKKCRATCGLCGKFTDEDNAPDVNEKHLEELGFELCLFFLLSWFRLGCTDSPGWKDADNFGCNWWRDFCENDAVDEAYWTPEELEEEHFPNKNCCGCGRAGKQYAKWF